MGIEFFFAAVILLACFAAFDLMVGVSNDAVNFLNSSIGSRVAPRHIIMIIASLGILAGVTFSSGMMEVARKGIFNPGLFTMPELMFIFLAVMITDVILLDFFNTYGFPTSTTVSIVFELLGAAVAVSLIKIYYVQGGTLLEYINYSKAIVIITGILLSVVVAFVSGALAQASTRMIFTFDYMNRLKKFGALWGSIGLASILYFIVVKGAKGTSFIPDATAAWIQSQTFTVFLIFIPALFIILQILIMAKVNILKPIVLMGTFALAMAFAANDLVNFIGVPMAGYHAFQAAVATEAPLTTTMGALAKTVPTQTYFLLLAGMIMVVTLWVSKKARTVTETEISLGQQDEGVERFESNAPSRFIVSFVNNTFNFLGFLIPKPLGNWFERRFDARRIKIEEIRITKVDKRPRFDLIRASVNLMVASAVISFATSQKLPLSTTYVTFMVAMGTSFADRAWGRESAVYRVSGVMAVIGGWFLTAISAFTVSAIFAVILFFGKLWGMLALLVFGTLIVLKNRRTHSERSRADEMDEIFNLVKVNDLHYTIDTSFQHMGYLIRGIRMSLNKALDALFKMREHELAIEKNQVKRIQQWTNIIIANIFKALRLMQKEDIETSYNYGQTIRRLQKFTDGHRDIVMRAHSHISNQHDGLLESQKEELGKVKEMLNITLREVEQALVNRQLGNREIIEEQALKLNALAERLHEQQLQRIVNRESKTRLSILFYAIIGNAIMLTKQSQKILTIFNGSLEKVNERFKVDLD